MSPENFIKAYEAALASQEWCKVEPLISDKAFVTFSSGKVNAGKPDIQKAYEHNFSMIKGENYTMSNIRWVTRELDYAVYLFNYQWSGMINNKLVSGSGVGTSTIIKEEGNWKLLAEHLGKKV